MPILSRSFAPSKVPTHTSTKEAIMMPAEYTVEIANCRNIRNACVLPIKENSLNVFFAKNGTGKTTISRAVKYLYENTDENLANLMSFDYLETNDSNFAPSIRCNRSIKRLDIFDKSWVDDHCFKASSLQTGAYELYIQNDEFRRYEKQRDKLLAALKYELLDSPDINGLQQDIATIIKGIGKATSGAVGKSTQVYKAYRNGVPIEPLPRFLAPVTRSMNVAEQAKWLNWHMTHPDTHAKDRCPYCGTRNPTVMNECLDYDNRRDEKSVSAWSRLAQLFTDKHDVFARSVITRTRAILSSHSKPSNDDLLFLCKVSASASSANDAIEGMKSALADDKFLDASDLIPTLNALASQLSNCDIFRKTLNGGTSPQAKAIKTLLEKIKRLEDKQAELEKLTSALQNEAALNIRGREDEINGFLQRCGYNYHVKITTSIASHNASILLVADTPTGKSHVVRDAVDSLSYGERNAFSLALFALQATSKPGGIVVLDDPISSFDIDKRFGILYMLFSDKSEVFSKNLLTSNKTILLLTHDYLVVSEISKITSRQFPKKRKQMWYLTCDAHGTLSKQEITQDSFAPYISMLKDRITRSSSEDDIIRLAYIRSLCEMLRNSPTDRRTRWGISFSLLSEIIHGRGEIEILARHKWKNKDDASRQIRTCEKLVADLCGNRFNYWSTVAKYEGLTRLVEAYQTVSSPYEKLQLVRMMLERDRTLNTQDKVMERFADDSCHIGGDYLFQLDPVDYDQVPFYVLDWCDTVASQAKNEASGFL